MKKDLTQLHKDINLALNANDITAPAFVVAFTCKETGHNTVHWASNTSRKDSIKLLQGLLDRMKSQLQ